MNELSMGLLGNLGLLLPIVAGLALATTPGKSAPGMSSARSFGAPVASTMASYRSCNSVMLTSVPTVTFPTKRTVSDRLTASYRR